MQHKDARLHLTKIPVFLYLNGLADLRQDPACSLQATHGQRLETDTSYHVETASSLLASLLAFHAHCIDNIAPWPHVHMSRASRQTTPTGMWRPLVSYLCSQASQLFSINGEEAHSSLQLLEQPQKVDSTHGAWSIIQFISSPRRSSHGTRQFMVTTWLFARRI